MKGDSGRQERKPGVTGGVVPQTGKSHFSKGRHGPTGEMWPWTCLPRLMLHSC